MVTDYWFITLGALLPRPTSSSNSPSKNVELRSKYMQQLRELVNLNEIGALTKDEYEHERLTLVD